MCEPRRQPVTNTSRAVSNVLGVILVVGVVLIGVVAIVGFGVTGLTGSTTDLSETAVERDLSGLATAIDGITGHKQPSAATTSLELAASEVAGESNPLRVNETAGHFEVAVRNESGETVLGSTTLGRVAFERHGSTARVSYQSGLVFAAPDASTPVGVVQQNGFDYRLDEGLHGLTIAAIRIVGERRLDGTITVSESGTQSVYQRGVLEGGDELVIRITSGQREAWARTLQDYFPANRTNVTTPEDSAHTTMVFEVPPDGAYLDATIHEITLRD